jgi:hypothetical protein
MIFHPAFYKNNNPFTGIAILQAFHMLLKDDCKKMQLTAMTQYDLLINCFSFPTFEINVIK